jgi:hypothetical protein
MATCPRQAGNETTTIQDEEIEITPEMIKAGVREYARGDLRFESEGDIVESIVRVMMETHRLIRCGG